MKKAYIGLIHQISQSAYLKRSWWSKRMCLQESATSLMEECCSGRTWINSLFLFRNFSLYVSNSYSHLFKGFLIFFWENLFQLEELLRCYQLVVPSVAACSSYCSFKSGKHRWNFLTKSGICINPLYWIQFCDFSVCSWQIEGLPLESSNLSSSLILNVIM